MRFLTAPTGLGTAKLTPMGFALLYPTYNILVDIAVAAEHLLDSSVTIHLHLFESSGMHLISVAYRQCHLKT